MQPQGASRIGPQDPEPQVFVVVRVATLGNVIQFCCQPATNGVIVIFGDMAVDGLVEVADIGDGHDPPGIFRFRENGLLGFFIVFIFNITHNLLKDIFHGDKAGNAAIFIDGDGKMIAVFLEVAQQLIEFLVSGTK